MALGRREQDCFPPLSHTLPVAAGLLASAFLALLAGPIPLARLSPLPEAGCCRAGSTTVPGKGMRRRKPLLASLQQANPRATMGRSLRWYRRAIMLNHGPSRAPTPEGQVPAAQLLLRSGAFWIAHLLLVQPRSSLITPPPPFHPFLGQPATWPPSRRDFVARGLAPVRRETGPLFRRD